MIKITFESVAAMFLIVVVGFAVIGGNIPVQESQDADEYV